MSVLSDKRPFNQPLKAVVWYAGRVALVLSVIALGVAIGLIMLTPAQETLVAGVFILVYLIVAARNPLYGLLLLIVTQPLADTYINLSLGAGIPDLSPTRICIGFLTTLVLARALVGHTKLARFTRVDAIAVLFLAGMTLSAPNGKNGWHSFQNIFDLSFIPIFVYFLAKNLVHNKEQLRKVLSALVILATFVGLYAIYEQLTGHILFVVTQEASTDYGNGLRILRGLLGHPNEFGRILDIAIPLVFYMLLEEKEIGKRALYAIILVIVALGLYLTFRRTAWIAALSSLFIIQWFYPRFRNLFFVLLVAAVGLIFLNQDRLEESAASARIQDGDTDTLNGRTEGWNFAVELWKRKPITGQGYAQFRDIAKQEGQRDTAIESQYLFILVSSGLLGFAPYVMLLLAIPLSFVKTFRTSNDPMDKWLIVAFWGAHLSYLVNAYTATINQLVTTSVLFLFAGALSSILAQPHTE